MAHSNRGKWSEGRVLEWITIKSTLAAFTGARLPDAHAGSLVPALADFDMLYAGKYYLLEVKEVDHAFRLPHKNFATDKVARMTRRQMAGATCWVLVYQKPLGLPGRAWQQAVAWRAVPLRVFQERSGGSWDLQAYPLRVFHAAMEFILSDAANCAS